MPLEAELGCWGTERDSCCREPLSHSLRFLGGSKLLWPSGGQLSGILSGCETFHFTNKETEAVVGQQRLAQCHIATESGDFPVGTGL